MNTRTHLYAVRASAVAALLVMASAGPLAAQSLPLGGRTASMGGAAVASGSDSAMPVLHPAGLALVPHSTVSLSASLYAWNTYRAEDFFIPAGTDPALGPATKQADTLEASSFDSFPGSAVLLYHLGGEVGQPGHQVLGMSITVPRSETLAVEGSSTATFGESGSITYSESGIEERTTWLFGPTYSVELGFARLGASALMRYSSFSTTSEGETLTLTKGFATTFITSNFTDFSQGYRLGLQPVVGLQAPIAAGLEVGLSATLPNIPLASDLEGTSSFEFNATTGDLIENTTLSGTSEENTPWLFQLGVAYTRPRTWSVALDAQLSLATDDAFSAEVNSDVSSLEQNSVPQTRQVTASSTIAAATTFQLRAGAEWYVNPNVALRVGGFYAPNPLEIATALENQRVFDVDVVGGSLGVGLGNDAASTDIGVSFARGTGGIVAPDAYSEAGQSNVARVDAEYTSVVLFISGTVDFAEMQDALEQDLNKAIP